LAQERGFIVLSLEKVFFRREGRGKEKKAAPALSKKKSRNDTNLLKGKGAPG